MLGTDLLKNEARRRDDGGGPSVPPRGQQQQVLFLAGDAWERGKVKMMWGTRGEKGGTGRGREREAAARGERNGGAIAKNGGVPFRQRDSWSLLLSSDNTYLQ
jgi:hypothetical protein